MNVDIEEYKKGMDALAKKIKEIKEKQTKESTDLQPYRPGWSLLDPYPRTEPRGPGGMLTYESLSERPTTVSEDQVLPRVGKVLTWELFYGPSLQLLYVTTLLEPSKTAPLSWSYFPSRVMESS